MDCFVAFIHNHKLAQICHKGKKHGEQGAGIESGANKSVSQHLIHYAVKALQRQYATHKNCLFIFVCLFIYYDHNVVHTHIIINGQM